MQVVKSERMAAITPDRDLTAHTCTHRRPQVSLWPAVVWRLEEAGHPEARTKKVNPFHSYITTTEADRGYLHQPLNKRSSIYLNTHADTQLTHSKHTVKSVETHTRTPNTELLTNGLRVKKSKSEKDKTDTQEREGDSLKV